MHVTGIRAYALPQQNTVCYDRSIRTHWGADPVGFGVNEASNLGEVAVALRGKLDGGGLHEECVVRGEHAVNPFLNVFHHH